MTKQIILLSLVGGLLSLDRVWAQIMISRPIVAAPVAGFILGDIYTGLQAGALLELFWIDRLPIGTVLPPNDFLVAFLAAAASILVGQQLGHVSRELVAFSILLFIPCGYLGQGMDKLIIKTNDTLYESLLSDIKRGDLNSISRKHLSGLLKNFLAYACLTLVLLPGGVILMLHIFPLLPEALIQGLKLTFFSLALLGLAAGLNTLNLKGAIPVFCALFLVLSLILEGVRTF